MWEEILPDDLLIKVLPISYCHLHLSLFDITLLDCYATGDRMPGVPPGQFSKLGKQQLVPQLNQGQQLYLCLYCYSQHLYLCLYCSRLYVGCALYFVTPTNSILFYIRTLNPPNCPGHRPERNVGLGRRHLSQPQPQLPHGFVQNMLLLPFRYDTRVCLWNYDVKTNLKSPAPLKPFSQVPIKLKFDPETVHMCTKLSGVAASYSTKEKFDSILHFLSKRLVLKY